jgi:hypothetical protein
MSMNTPVDCFTADDGQAVEITPLCGATLSAWLESCTPRHRAWCKSTGFEGRRGEICLLPNDEGELEQVLVGGDPVKSPFMLGDARQRLPAGRYRLSVSVISSQMRNARTCYWARRLAPTVSSAIETGPVTTTASALQRRLRKQPANRFNSCCRTTNSVHA